MTEGIPIGERAVEKAQVMDSTDHPEEVSMVAIQVENMGDRAKEALVMAMKIRKPSE